MTVKLFRKMNHEDNSEAENVRCSLIQGLAPGQRTKRDSLKVLGRNERKQTCIRSKLVHRVRVTRARCPPRHSRGDARDGMKTSSKDKKTRVSSQLSKNKLGTSDAYRTRLGNRRERKQKQFFQIHFRSYSEGCGPLDRRLKSTLRIRRQFCGPRTIASIFIGLQPVSRDFWSIARKPLNLSIRSVGHQTKFGLRRIGHRPIYFGFRRSRRHPGSHCIRRIGHQLLSIGIRRIGYRPVNLQRTCNQSDENKKAGKRSVECGSRNVQQERTWSQQRLHVRSKGHNTSSKNCPTEDMGTNISRLSPSRSDDACQDNPVSHDSSPTHSLQEKNWIHGNSQDTKPLLGSRLSRTGSGSVGLASSWLSGIRLPTLLLMCMVAGVAEACPYATVDPRHTMCVFMPKQCPGKMLIRTGELTCHDKERILTKHNMLRQEAALGQVRGQPAAINMKTMVWDDELAMVAQRWADQCMPGHDRSRNVPRFAAGQNVAAVWTYERDEGVEPDFLTQVEAWFMEVDQHGFSKGAVDPFKFSKPTGHYTQLVWADTYLVGCGYVYYHDAAGNGYTKLYVCNYGPGGNVVGGSMYKVGYPGQPYCVANGLRPSTDYQGLCEEDGVNYKSMCSMGGSSMFHKPKTSSLMMLMDGNSVVDDFAHSHARSNSPTHPMEVMHPDPPHMEMHDMMQHHSSMMRNGPSRALHRQQGHMMLPPPSLPHNFPQNHLGGNSPHNQGGDNGLIKTIQAPFAGLVNALSPWNFLNRFKMN